MALLNLALLLVTAGEEEPADRLLGRVLSARPDHAEAWIWRGAGHQRAARTDEAAEAFSRAAALNPSMVEAQANLLRLAGRRAEALKSFEDAILINQSAAVLWSGLSVTALELDDIQMALNTARRAIELDADLADGHANLGQVLHRSGDCASAVEATRRALELATDNLVLKLNLATHLLGAGRLSEGWDVHEWRMSGAHCAPAAGLPSVRWTEGAPPGKRLLITAEQGLGDEIEFATCLPEVERLRAEGVFEVVILECSERLTGLFARSFLNFAIEPRLHSRETARQPADYGPMVARHGADCHLAIGSLPGLFCSTLEDFERSGPVLVPDADRAGAFRAALDGLGTGCRLGISWRSLAGRDRSDSLYSQLEDWRALFELADVVPVNLQYDGSREEIAEFAASGGARVHSLDGLDLMQDIDGVAALISSLDLVISTDNTVFQIAAAVGTPVLVMSTGYYWPSLGTGTSPWYRDVDLFTREIGESWAALLHRVAMHVADRAV
jgi:Tfp pilus assembly protein PilF